MQYNRGCALTQYTIIILKFNIVNNSVFEINVSNDVIALRLSGSPFHKRGPATLKATHNNNSVNFR